MARKHQNIQLWYGDHQDVAIIVTGYDDLVGASVKWAMARTSSSPPVLEKVSPTGVTTEGNVATIHFEPDDTSGLTAGRYYHELEITDALGNISTVAIGKVRLHSTVINEEVEEEEEE